jgi:UMF1 family MFS transporter
MDTAKKKTLAWALYDFANTIFSMNVVSLYFPLVVVNELGGKDIHVSLANSAGMILVLLTMPLWGEYSDRRGRRTPFLTGFTLLSVIATVFMGIFAKQQIGGGSIFILIAFCLLYVLANYGFQGGMVFYNSMLTSISTKENSGRTSGFGTALGYLGSIFGMIMVLPFNEGSIFGLVVPFIKGGGRANTFIPSGLLFGLFALPVIFMFWVKKRTHTNITDVKGSGLRAIWQTLKDSKNHPGILRFLVADFLFNDGIQTAIIFMGIFAVKVMGLTDRVMTGFFIISTIGSVAGGFLFGYLSVK